jgi:hypothetical protein
MADRPPVCSGAFSCLLESSFTCVDRFSLCKHGMWVFLDSFQLRPYKNRHSPKLVEFYQWTPYIYVVFAVKSFFMFRWWLKLTLIYRQKLLQAYLLLVLEQNKLSDGSGVVTIHSRLRSTHVFKQELSSGLEWTIVTFKLTHITFYHGACSRHLGLAQLKDRTVKSSAIFLALWSTIIPEFCRFSNKTQRFLCMTLSSLSFVVFVDPYQGIDGVCLLSQNIWYFWYKAE